MSSSMLTQRNGASDELIATHLRMPEITELLSAFIARHEVNKYNEQCPTNERQTMRVVTTGVCRGNWKIYQQLKIEGVHEASSVTAQATTDDNRRLPLSLLNFRDNSDEPNSYVLVIPDPDVRTIIIELNEIDSDGRTLSSDSISLNCKNIKWESRLNYKIKPEMCSKLRNYDDVSEFDMATIDFWQCIEDSNEYILRCTVRTPYRSDSQIKVRCLDRSLNEVNLTTVDFGSNVTSVGFAAGKKQLETQLSVRMPKAFDRYYFIIDDQNHPSFSSFDCLTPDKLGLLLEETNFLLPMHSLILNTPNGSRSIRQPLEHWKSREK